MNGALVIKNVDLELLNEQRLELARLRDDLHMIDAEFPSEQALEALAGVVNLLDGWYDENFPPGD